MSRQLDLGAFTQGERIGKGSFATVYKGLQKSTNTAVAIKVVHRAHLNKDKRLLDNFEAEMRILKKLKHPHVVSLIEVVQTQTDFHLVMEYCSLGDLSYFIRKRSQLIRTLPLVAAMFERYPSPDWGGLNETVVRHFLCQLASALEFLRANHLVHRDIKPQNLLLRPPAKSESAAQEAGYAGLWELPVLKIADFGFARFLPATSMAETLCGSPLYMAPEILHYEKYNAKADLWSVGAVVYEMAVGKPPFPAVNHMDLIKKIDSAKDNIKYPADTAVGEQVKQLVSGLLKRSPAERMGFDEFFAHPALDVIGNGPLRSQEIDENMYVSEYIAQASKDQLPQPDDAAAPSLPTTPLIRSQVLTDSPTSRLGSSPGLPVSPTAMVSPPLSAATSPAAPRSAASMGSSYAASGARSERSDDGSYVLIEKRTVEVNALADDLAKPAKAPTPKRRLSITYGTSPTNALAQALIKSSARLFGAKIDSVSGINTPSLRRTTQASTGAVAAVAAQLPSLTEDSEKTLAQELSDLAAMGKVVGLYADIKFSGVESRVGSSAASRSQVSSPVSDPTLQDVLAQEALALYLKAASLYSRAMDKAQKWWAGSDTPVATPTINNIVQYIRDRFNETVERAESARQLILNGAEDNFSPAQHVSAEKLLFDRALEMARAAAVQEMGSSDLAACEVNYGTAVWMLRALLDGSKPDEALSVDDKTMVDALMEKIALRVQALKKRIASLPQANSTSRRAPTP